MSRFRPSGLSRIKINFEPISIRCPTEFLAWEILIGDQHKVSLCEGQYRPNAETAEHIRMFSRISTYDPCSKNLRPMIGHAAAVIGNRFSAFEN
jgi:hypothetical protein